MTKTVLEKIVADKYLTVEGLKTVMSEQLLKAEVKPSDRNFYKALQQQSPCYILECKKASPSKGLLRKDFDLNAIATVYGQWASVISVLTDSQYFQGRMSDLVQVRARVRQPVLCKDFFISAYQVRLARYHGADAILLMLSVLNDDEYKQLSQLAHDLNMGVLCEISNEQELERAIKLDAKVIGINNRNLRDLSIDLTRCKRLAPKIPNDRIKISESGISSHAQIRDLSRYVDGFLIGSSLMSQSDLHRAVADLLCGVNKLCGITRKQDAISAYHAGVHYGGLIFCKRSPRYVDFVHANTLVNSAPLSWVGVFENEEIATVVEYAINLKLSAVQLHGQESPQYIAQLKSELPELVQIWKSHGISETLPDLSQWLVQKHLLDTRKGSQTGGTGQTFDWNLLQGQDLSQVVLAGGLNADNAALAADIGCAVLDFNSGLETAPGIKSVEAIETTMQSLRQF